VNFLAIIILSKHPGKCSANDSKAVLHAYKDAPQIDSMSSKGYNPTFVVPYTFL